jgi:hypothetical protein
MKTIQIFNKACKQILVVLLLSTITFTVNAQVCTSTKDYETGLKNGLKMAPPCELTNTSKLQKCVGDYSPTTWSTCYGERTAANGGTYRGGYLEGKAHGKGEFVNPDGSRYLGDYVKGQRNGYGKEYSATGAIVKAGEWNNGVFAGSTPQGQDKTANSNRVTGSFKCTNTAMMDEISGRETLMKGNDVWSITLNGSSGILITPTGKLEQLTYQKSISGPKASGDLYSVPNSELMESIQLMIDNVPSGGGKGTLVTKMKPAANMKLMTLGFCKS